MKKYLIFSGLMLYAFTMCAQGLINNGARIVIAKGTYLVTDGSGGHVTNTDGAIDLAGTLQLTGNFWNNNALSNALGTVVSGGEVIFAGSGAQTIGGTSSVVFNFPNLTVRANADVRVEAGKKITLTGDLINNGTFSLLTDADDAVATVLTSGEFLGAGVYNMQSYLTAGRNWYVSSPVIAAESAILNAASHPLYWYDETKGSSAPWISIADDTTILEPLKGYIATVAVDGITTFTGGAFNNSNVDLVVNRTSGVTKEGFHLLGNPYPAYFDVADAAKTNILPTFWYRSKNAANTGYVFDTYNLACCAGISLSGRPVTNNIPPMQAFWVRAGLDDSKGIITFAKSNCHHNDNCNNRRRVSANNRQLIRMQVSNGTNYDEALLVFSSDASDSYDKYDSPKMTNGSVVIPEIYTKAESEIVSINGMSVLLADRIVPLGFSTGQANRFGIKATEISGFDSSVKISLLDKEKNVEYDLGSGQAYNFESTVVNTLNRFEVIFKSSSTITDNKSLPACDIDFYRTENRTVLIKRTGLSELQSIASVFNCSGQLLLTSQFAGLEKELHLPYSTGMYFVKVSNAEMSKIEKIIIE